MRLHALTLALAVVLSPALVRAEEEKPAPAAGAAEEKPVPKAPVRVAVIRNEYGKRVFEIDGEATALFWCYGVEEPEDLKAYAEAGFNCVWVPLPWSKEHDWDKTDKLIAAAAEHELWVILAIQTGAPSGSGTVRVSAQDKDYRKLCSEWIQSVVKRYVDTPHLIAWATQDDPAAVIKGSDEGFVQYLGTRYPSMADLSAAWNREIHDSRQVTRAETPLFDDQAPPFFARPSLDLLLYQWRDFMETLAFWAQEIDRGDKARPLFTGRLRDYKSIIAVPPVYDAILPDLIPGVLEADGIAHNPHGIDIARRAGAFCAIPNLQCALQKEGDPATQLSSWMRTAALHGATGLSLADWAALKGNEAARKSVRETWDELVATGMLARDPVPTSAILYEPTGEGVVVDGRGLYGFGDRFSLGEPNKLIYSLRRGTRHGQLDYLGLDSLGRRDVDLRQYGVILAPLALTLDADAVAALQAYVFTGGVLVADVGVGMAESGNTMAQLSPPLQELFGSYGIERFISGRRNMSILLESAPFPSLRKGQATSGSAQGAAFGGALGRVRPWRDALSFGLVYPGTRGVAGPGSCVLTINRYGNGYAVYAPFWLWSTWLMNDDLWQPFHDDLFGRVASLTVQNTRNSLVHRTLEVAALREAVGVVNQGPRQEYAVIDTVGANNILLSDCVATLFSSSYPAPALYADHHYARLGNTSLARIVENERPRVQRLHLIVPPAESRVCRMVPIRVEPGGESCVAQLLSCTKDEVRLRLYSQGARVTAAKGGTLKIRPRNPSEVRVAVSPGLYELTAGSKHVVTVTDLQTKRGRKSVFDAGNPPMLVWEERVRAVELTIRPARAAETAQ